MNFLISKPVNLIRLRLLNSFLNFPSMNDWVWTSILLLIFSLIVIPLGIKFKFLRIEIPQISFTVIFRLSLVTLIFPATAEEIFFRIILLPHKFEQVPLIYQFIWASISLILFIIYHPLNATLFIQSARTIFNNFVFLTSAGFLGIICTIAYLKSGSIYPSITLHWVIVLVWLLVFGGYQSLHNLSK